MEKAKEFQKNICFCFIDYAKVFDCVDHIILWKILKNMGVPGLTLSVSWEICMQVKKQYSEPDVEQQAIQNWGRSMTGLYIVTLLI